MIIRTPELMSQATKILHRKRAIVVLWQVGRCLFQIQSRTFCARHLRQLTRPFTKLRLGCFTWQWNGRKICPHLLHCHSEIKYTILDTVNYSKCKIFHHALYLTVGHFVRRRLEWFVSTERVSMVNADGNVPSASSTTVPRDRFRLSQTIGYALPAWSVHKI